MSEPQDIFSTIANWHALVLAALMTFFLASLLAGLLLLWSGKDSFLDLLLTSLAGIAFTGTGNARKLSAKSEQHKENKNGEDSSDNRDNRGRDNSGDNRGQTTDSAPPTE